MHDISLEIITPHGEYKLVSYGDKVGVDTKNIGFAYYFAIG